MKTPQDTRTDLQKVGLLYLLENLKLRYPKAQVYGHCDFPGVIKACPSFDVRQEYGVDFCKPWNDGQVVKPKDYRDKDYSVPDHITASPWG